MVVVVVVVGGGLVRWSGGSSTGMILTTSAGHQENKQQATDEIKVAPPRSNGPGFGMPPQCALWLQVAPSAQITYRPRISSFRKPLRVYRGTDLDLGMQCVGKSTLRAAKSRIPNNFTTYLGRGRLQDVQTLVLRTEPQT